MLRSVLGLVGTITLMAAHPHVGMSDERGEIRAMIEECLRITDQEARARCNASIPSALARGREPAQDHWQEAVAICRNTVWADAASRRECANIIAEHGTPTHRPRQVEPTETMIDLGQAEYPDVGTHACQLMRCWDYGDHRNCRAQTFVTAGPC